MFHLELRRFPHLARVFNLSEQELEARFLDPWLAGRPVEWDDRRWEPERARLKIYEGPELRTDQLGLGRGWAEVTRSGSDVTERMLARRRADEQAAGARLREEVLRRCASGALGLEELIALGGDAAAAERVVLELLREGRIGVVARPRR